MSFILQFDDLGTPTSTMTEVEFVRHIMNRAADGVDELKQRLEQWKHEEKNGGQPGSARQKAERYLHRYFEMRKVFCERPKVLRVLEDKGQKPPGTRPSDLVEVSDRPLNFDTSNEEQTGDGTIQTVCTGKYTNEKSFPKETSPDTLCSSGKATASNNWDTELPVNVSEADKKEVISQGPLKTAMRNIKLSEEAVKKSCQSFPPEVKKAQQSPPASRDDENHASSTFSNLPRKDQSHYVELGLEEKVEKENQSQPSVSDNKYTASPFAVKARQKLKNLKDKRVPSLQKNEQTEKVQLTLKEGDKQSPVTVCDISVKKEDIKLLPLKDICLGSLESPHEGPSTLFDIMADMQVKHLKDEIAKAYTPQDQAKAQYNPMRDIEITDQAVEKPDQTPLTGSHSKYPASSFESKAMKTVKHLKDKFIKVPSLQTYEQTESIQLGSEDERAKWSPITVYIDSVKEEEMKSLPPRKILPGPPESPNKDIKSPEKAVEKSCWAFHPASLDEIQHLKDKLIKVSSLQTYEQTENVQLGSEDGAKLSPITVYDESVKEEEIKSLPPRDIFLDPLESPKRDIKRAEKAVEKSFQSSHTHTPEEGPSALLDNMADMQVKHPKDPKAHSPQTQAKAQYSPMRDFEIIDQAVEKPDQTPSTCSHSKYPAFSIASKAMKKLKHPKDKFIKVPSLHTYKQTENIQLASEDEGAKLSPTTVCDISVKEEDIKLPPPKDISLGSPESRDEGPPASIDNMADMQVKHPKDEHAKAHSPQTQAKALYSPMRDIEIIDQAVEKPDQTPPTGSHRKYPASSIASKAMRKWRHLKDKLIKVLSLQKNQTESIQLGSEDEGAKWSPITVYDDSIKEEEIKSPPSRDISPGPPESPERDIKSAEKAVEKSFRSSHPASLDEVKHLKDELIKGPSLQKNEQTESVQLASEDGDKLSPFTVYDNSVKEEEIQSLPPMDIFVGPPESPNRDIKSAQKAVEKSCWSSHPASLDEVKHLKDELIKVPSLRTYEENESVQLGSEDERVKLSPITVYDDSVKEEEIQSLSPRDISLGPLESPKRDVKGAERAVERSRWSSHAASLDEVKHLKDELINVPSCQTYEQTEGGQLGSEDEGAKLSPITVYDDSVKEEEIQSLSPRDISLAPLESPKRDIKSAEKAVEKSRWSSHAASLDEVKHLKDELIKVPSLRTYEENESIQLGSEDERVKLSPITVYDDSVKEEEIQSPSPRDISLGPPESPKRDVKSAEKAVEKSRWSSHAASLDEVKHLKDELINVPSCQTHEQTESGQLGSEDEGAKLSPITVYDDSVKEEEIKALPPRGISLGPLELPNRDLKSAEKAVENSCRSSHTASLDEVKHLKDELIKVPSLQKYEQTESIQLSLENEGDELSLVTACDNSIKEERIQSPPSCDITLGSLESPKRDIKRTKEAVEKSLQSSQTASSDEMKHLKNEPPHSQAIVKCSHSGVKWTCTEKAVKKSHQSSHTASQDKDPSALFDNTADMQVKHLTDKLAELPRPHRWAKFKCSHCGLQGRSRENSVEKFHQSSHTASADKGPSALFDNTADMQVKHLTDKLAELPRPHRWAKFKCSHSGLQWRSTEKAVEKSHQSSHTASADKGPSAPPFAGKAKKKCKHLMNEHEQFPSPQKKEQIRTVQLGLEKEADKLSPVSVDDNSVKEEASQKISWWRRLFRFKMNKVYPVGHSTSNQTSKKKSLCSWLFKRKHKISPSPETSPPSNHSPKRSGKKLQMLFCCASAES